MAPGQSIGGAKLLRVVQLVGVFALTAAGQGRGAGGVVAVEGTQGASGCRAAGPTRWKA